MNAAGSHDSLSAHEMRSNSDPESDFSLVRMSSNMTYSLNACAVIFVTKKLSEGPKANCHYSVAGNFIAVCHVPSNTLVYFIQALCDKPTQSDLQL